MGDLSDLVAVMMAAVAQMLTINGFVFNTSTFGYFYDHFVRSRRMKDQKRTGPSIPSNQGIDGPVYSREN
jgi:hypothetical protein